MTAAKVFEPKPCSVCEKPFTPKSSDNHCCPDLECRREALRRRKRKQDPLDPINCVICVDLFTPGHGNQTTCKNKVCRRARDIARQRERRRLKGAVPRSGVWGLGVKKQEAPAPPDSFPCIFTDHLDSKGNFEPRWSAMDRDFHHYSHAQNDPFGKYDDYAHHTPKPEQREAIAA